MFNRMMPDTLTYERASQIAPILEDVYTGNVSSFKKRLVREANIEIIAALYFIVTTFVMVLAMFKAGEYDWFALIIFGILAYRAISGSIKLSRAKMSLKANPTPERCAEIADDTYDLDYTTYYDARNEASYQDVLPPRPKYYMAFKVFSIVFATIALLLGLLFIIASVFIILSQTSLKAGAVAGMDFLYGLLAAYFGVKDFVVCVRPNSISREQTA